VQPEQRNRSQPNSRDHPTTTIGKEKTRGRAACFSKSKIRKEGYGFFGLEAAGEVVVVVVVVAGLVAGFSVVVVAGFLFNAVTTSVVKSKQS
jgi:hypothetical protein